MVNYVVAVCVVEYVLNELLVADFDVVAEYAVTEKNQKYNICGASRSFSDQKEIAKLRFFEKFK